MDTAMTTSVAIMAAVAMFVWVVVKLRWVDRRIVQAKQLAAEIEQNANQKTEQAKKEKLVEAKDQIFIWRSEAEKEDKNRRRELNRLENRLAAKEDNIQSKEQVLIRKDQENEKR